MTARYSLQSEKKRRNITSGDVEPISTPACDCRPTMEADMRSIVIAAVASLLALSLIAVNASDPTSCYAVVDKVIFEPSESHRENSGLGRVYTRQA